MVFRYVLDRRSGQQRLGTIIEVTVRPIPTIAIGAVGGLIVGLTSVGSGSLMIVLLLFVYPLIGANQLVGTDLTQAVPLTAAAALGALAFGHPEFSVTAAIAIGSVPAVLVGSFLSSRAPDRLIRPVITFVIFASGLKYVGVPTTALGITLAAVVVGGLSFWLVRAQPWRRGVPAAHAADALSAGAGSLSLSGAAGGTDGATAGGMDGAAPRQVLAHADGQGQIPAPVTVPLNDAAEPREKQSPPSTGLD